MLGDLFFIGNANREFYLLGNIFFIKILYEGNSFKETLEMLFTICFCPYISFSIFKKIIMDLAVAATLIIIICGILFLIRPINHPNRTVSYEEDRAFHKMKNRNIILVFVFSLCLYFAHMEEYLSLISYTLIAILLSALAGENMQKLFLG